MFIRNHNFLLLTRIHTDSERTANNYEAINNVPHVGVMSVEQKTFGGSMINIIGFKENLNSLPQGKRNPSTYVKTEFQIQMG